MTGAAQRLGSLSMLARGAGLHAMDGGAISAAVSAAGLRALLELVTAIAQGYYRSPPPVKHQLPNRVSARFLNQWLIFTVYPEMISSEHILVTV